MERLSSWHMLKKYLICERLRKWMNEGCCSGLFLWRERWLAPGSHSLKRSHSAIQMDPMFLRVGPKGSFSAVCFMAPIYCIVVQSLGICEQWIIPHWLTFIKTIQYFDIWNSHAKCEQLSLGEWSTGWTAKEKRWLKMMLMVNFKAEWAFSFCSFLSYFMHCEVNNCVV